MRLIEHQSAASSKITVTNAATLLYSLINTAGSVTNSEQYFSNLLASGILITPEDGDIRVMVGQTPDATHGTLLSSATKYYIPLIDLTRVRLIRTGAADVHCSIDLFKADIDDTFFGGAEKVEIEGLTFDGSGNLNVNVQVGGGGGIDPVGIKASALTMTGTATGGKNGLDVYVTNPSGADPVGIKNALGVQINPSTAERQDANTDAVWLLRRIVKLLEASGNMDSQQRQRIAIDAPLPTGSNTIGTVGVGTVTTVSTVTSLSQISGVDAKYFLEDTARNAYANGIRANLSFS